MALEREKAIGNLEYAKRWKDRPTDETIDMAIKALEQEPCEDWCDVPSDEMTLEQARQAVKDLRKFVMDNHILPKLQYCEDCISRQAVLDIAKSSKSNWIDNSVLFKKVNELPPVEPEKCGDCVSRQAVLGVQSKYAEYVGATKFWQMRDDIKELPPVIPQPCEDAISRQTVLDLVNADWKYEGLEAPINSMPPVIPQQARWISVSERLPEEGEEVLVSGYDMHNKKVIVARYQGEQYGFTCGLVSAWMPLPKPYESQESEG